MMLRATLLVVLLAAAQLTVGYVKRGYTLGRVEPPERDLTTLPKQLGPWSGEDRPIDERIQEYLQARSGVDRVYRNRVGDEVSAHVVWTDDYIKIHFPQQCYRESGWEHTATKSIDVDFAEHYRDAGWSEVESVEIDVEAGGDETFPSKLLTFERDGRRIHVLYWFQMGDEFFFDRIRHRNLRRQVCWGNRDWPPLVKVMLESPASSKRAEEHLRSIAGRVYAWMQNS